MGNKHAKDVTIQATVIDEDTVHIGGSFFKRERTCKNERFHYAPYEHDAFTCSKCGGSVYEIDGKWAVKGRDGDYEYDAVILFCPLCGARVECDA